MARERHAIVVSRNPASSLCGHSLLAWHLCGYLIAKHHITVHHITHTPDQLPANALRDKNLPLFVHTRAGMYNVQFCSLDSHPKIPDTFAPCNVADAMFDKLHALSNLKPPVNICVILISPFAYAADVLNVCLSFNVSSCVALLRGTDTLALQPGSAFAETRAARRYLDALNRMPGGVLTVSHWLVKQAAEIGVTSVKGVLSFVTDIPRTHQIQPHKRTSQMEKLESILQRLRIPPTTCDLSNINTRLPLITFAGRICAEKGAVHAAREIKSVLASESAVMAVIAGQGEQEQEVCEILQEFIQQGRVGVGFLPMHDLLVVAQYTRLLVLHPGGDGKFREALCSAALLFGANGAGVMWPHPSEFTGGIPEAVSPLNCEWNRQFTSSDARVAEMARLASTGAITMRGREEQFALISRANAAHAEETFTGAVQVDPWIREWFGSDTPERCPAHMSTSCEAGC